MSFNFSFIAKDRETLLFCARVLNCFSGNGEISACRAETLDGFIRVARRVSRKAIHFPGSKARTSAAAYRTCSALRLRQTFPEWRGETFLITRHSAPLLPIVKTLDILGRDDSTTEAPTIIGFVSPQVEDALGPSKQFECGGAEPSSALLLPAELQSTGDKHRTAGVSKPEVKR